MNIDFILAKDLKKKPEWDTDTHGSFRMEITETERQPYSSAKPRSIRLILTARQSQKSPQPPFFKGGLGGFQRRVSQSNILHRIQRVYTLAV